MKKNKKKIMILALALVCVLSNVVFATSYTSTLSISSNSTAYGSYRDYDSGSMSINIKFESTEDAAYNKVNMDVQLQKKTLFSYDVKGTTTKDYLVGNYVTSYFGSQTSGDYRFYFSTWGRYPGGYADYVKMTSN